MNALIIFGASFVMIFSLGFQSQSVNQGHFKAAFITSFLVGTANLTLLKMVPAAHTVLEYAAFMTSGPLAITASMWVHRKTLGKKKP